MRLQPRLTLLSVGVAALMAAGCVQQTGLPSDCGSATVARAVTLDNDTFTPDHIDLCRGQQVTITVTVKQDGTLHFHGYDDVVPETEVASGEERTFTFSTVHAGQFPIELHHPSGDEVQVGILTVNEP